MLARRGHLTTAAVATASVVLAVGLTYGSTSAGGADSYGYLSQADLWLEGDLHIEVPWVDDVPWQNADWTFAPLGYRPAGDRGARALVPRYAPGLPLLMALAKVIGGHPAAFAVVPIAGAILVLATYGIGRRLDLPAAGLLGAVLVATSPAFLVMLVQPMADVPAAAAMAVAAYRLIDRRRSGPVLAGLAAAVAVLIRPNLVFLVGVLGLWFVVEAARDWPRPQYAIRRAAAFGVAAASGMAVVAAINAHLYGSPLTSGYGDVGAMFARAHVRPNAANYLEWLADSSPIGLVGLLALAPLPWLWPAPEARRFIALAAVFTAAIWLHYCSYLVFDNWTYLRFLLPAWPFMMVAAAAVLQVLPRHRLLAVRLAGCVLIVLIAVQHGRAASAREVFTLARIERHYPAAALVLRGITPEGSVVLAMQHSGTVGYYGGRVVVRYDFMAPGDLDMAVEWLSDRSVPVYAMLQDFEVPLFERQFASQQVAGELEARRLLVYEGSSTITIYMLSGPVRSDLKPGLVAGATDRATITPPSPTPHPELRLSGKQGPEGP